MRSIVIRSSSRIHAYAVHVEIPNVLQLRSIVAIVLKQVLVVKHQVVCLIVTVFLFFFFFVIVDIGEVVARQSDILADPRRHIGLVFRFHMSSKLQ